MSSSTLNKKEKKIKGRKDKNLTFGIGEDELKNSIVEYENMPIELRAPLHQRGSALLEDIITKIENVVKKMDEEKLNKANISSLGTTLKSLVQAYHFLELHFQDDQSMNNMNGGFKLPSNPDEILEQTSEVVFRTKRKWDKGK